LISRPTRRERGKRTPGENRSSEVCLVRPGFESPLDLQATAFDFGGDEFLLFTFPVDPGDFSKLTAAEQEIAGELLRGKSYQDIARLRGTTGGTVANQVRSIFRKLQIRSRSELARTAGPPQRAP
jgi:DNA-binding NarL/FixJ family response regulator